MQDLALSLIYPLPQLLEVASNLELQVPRLLSEVPLLGFELVLLLMQVLALLIGNVKQALEVLEELRVCPPDRLHLVALVLSVDDALGADRRALAREAVVAHELIWVSRASGATAQQLRLPSVGRGSASPQRLLVGEG